jgi:ABC-2 type transport system permease protein
MIWALVTKTWRDTWKGTLSWGIGLVAIVAMELLVYPTFKESGQGMQKLLESMPAAFKSIFRMNDFTSGPGFLSTELFSMMIPLIFIAVGANAGARATAEEEGTGTADLLLALPLTRTKIILSKTFAALAVLVGLAVVLFLTLIIGVGPAKLVTPTSGLVAGCVEMALIGSLFTGVGLLAGAVSGRKGIALGVSIALAIAEFVLFSLAPLMKSFDRWVWLNPFQWAIGNNPIRNGIESGYAITLLLVTAGLILSSVDAFDRRDISN